MILLVQGHAVILRVPGDKDHASAAVLDDIRAGLVGLGQHDQILLRPDALQRNGGVPRMRHLEEIVKTARQGLLPGQQMMLIDAGQLVRQRHLVDPVVIIQRRLGSPADVDRRRDMRLGPLHDLRKLRPIVDFLKRNRLHRSPRDDHPVKCPSADLLKRHIELVEVPGIGVLGLVCRHVHEGDIHL